MIAPLLPAPKRVGRPRTTDLRDVVDAILYMASTRCQWRMLPNDFPPVSTVRGYFYDWHDDGLLRRMNHRLVMAAREAAGREASPTAGGIAGYDAGKKIKGRKRHIVTDTLGLLVEPTVHGADIQDRDGTPGVLTSIQSSYPWLRHIFADGGSCTDPDKRCRLHASVWPAYPPGSGDRMMMVSLGRGTTLHAVPT